MKSVYKLGIALVACLAAIAQTNSYTVTNIVDNTQDAFLVNPWGLSRPSSSTFTENQWWVSDNATGHSTLYYANKTGTASLAGLVVIIPSAGAAPRGSPTGTAFSHPIGPGPGANNFTFVTLDGTISNWNAGSTPPPGGMGCYKCHVNSATIMVNHLASGAVYTGLTVTKNAASNAQTYYVANSNGGVEAYDATSFSQVTLSGTFVDPKLPSAYKPFGIQAIGARIYVTLFNGLSGGFVDAFDTNGNLKLRLQPKWFSEPWGIAMAPTNFGAFGSMLLVANTASGWIGAYSPTTGGFVDFLRDSTGTVITIPGIWGIEFGNGNVESGPTNVLYFNGGGNYTTGVFGAISAN